MKQSKIEKTKEELKNVEEILKKQKLSSKDCLENAYDLLNELESRKNMQSKYHQKESYKKYVKEYQKSDKYKQYKREYYKKQRFNKVIRLGNEFIDNKIEKDYKKYKDNEIDKKKYIKRENNHLNNKELLNDLDTLKDYKNLFIVFYGKTNYKNNLANSK